jgi:small subunit ribosomal protein S8
MYYDLITRIKNAAHAKQETVHAPYSSFDHAIAKFLESEGYVGAVEKRTVGKKTVLDVTIKYAGGKPAFTDIRLVSKPGRRIYIGYREMRTVRQGHGLAAVSTPEGVMSNRSARKKKLGGEYLFQIW